MQTLRTKELLYVQVHLDVLLDAYQGVLKWHIHNILEIPAGPCTKEVTSGFPLGLNSYRSQPSARLSWLARRRSLLINEQIAGWLKNVHSASSVICTATQLFVEVKCNRWIRPEGSNFISANTEESKCSLAIFFYFSSTRAPFPPGSDQIFR